MLKTNPINFGKMFIVGFEGKELTDKIATKLKKLDPAGIIFFDTNIESREQVKKLIQDLKNLLGEDLIISVDQEGGKVQRLRKISPNLPSLMALGKVSAQRNDNWPLVQHTALLIKDLEDLGFNFVFAPCADLSTNLLNPVIGTRSLGNDCKIVMDQIETIITTFRNFGFACCIKHFPGHGATDKDSHLDLPHISLDHHNYMGHLSPFLVAIEEYVDAIMTAHIMVDIEDIASQSAQCSTHPVSISHDFITEDLRSEYGFSGLVISDEITMKALSEYGDYNELAIDMIYAGNNLIIWNTNLDDALKTADYLNNLKCSNIYQFYSRYHEAISKLFYLFDKMKGLKGMQPQVDFEKAPAVMLELSKEAIEFNKPLVELFQSQEINQKNTAIVIHKHPKLEENEIREVFKLDSYELAGLHEFDEVFFSRYKNIILLGFQTHFTEEGRTVIKKFRNIEGSNLVYVACDQPDPEADINLLGAAKIHYQALQQVLFT